MSNVQHDLSEAAGLAEEGDSHTSSHTSKFRFKSKKRSSDERRASHEESDPEQRRHRYRHHSRHHHRSKRSRPTFPDDQSSYDKTYMPNGSSAKCMDPDVAFRESLFDAMADDEGAQFWEGVYGQPIHTYPDVKQGPGGELERMTDEEYTAFVRSKMYEKTHQHLIEEKSRRDVLKKERERLAKEGRKEESEAQKFRDKVEESLRRGEERKRRRSWEEKWNLYTKKWEDLGKGDTSANIPWPVESGNRKDIRQPEIEKFFLFAPSSGKPSETKLAQILKLERVRWHPDKIQQKYGGQKIHEDTMQAVTAVFQIIDRMWREARAKN